MVIVVPMQLNVVMGSLNIKYARVRPMKQVIPLNIYASLTGIRFMICCHRIA